MLRRPLRKSQAGLAAAALLACAAPAAGASLSFQLNSPGDYDHGRQLVLPAAFGTGEFTLELWIAPDRSYPVGPVTPGTVAQRTNWSDESSAPYSASDWWYPGNFLLDGHNNSNFSAGTFSLQFYGGGRLRWLFGDGADPGPGGVWSVGAYPEAPEPTLLDGGWHQVSLVRRWSGASGAQLEMWIDGRLVDTQPTPVRTNMRAWWDAWAGFPGGQEGWFWGAEKQAAINVLSQYEDYKGLLDLVSFWSRAKTPSEIANTWRQTPVLGSPGLVGLYGFGEGAGGTTCDLVSPAQCTALVHMQPGYWSSVEAPVGAGTALRFFGNGAIEENQVKVRIDAPAVPADVGTGDFTLEFWMKALPGANPAGPCQPGGSGWIYGDIVFDRDVFGSGDYGDYGVSIANGRVVWGLGGADGAGYFENTICGSRVVTDGLWHHVAVTRSASTSLLRVFVDGQPDAQGPGPDGDTSYRNGRPTSYPVSDPFLVIGAEKHFGANGWNGFSGWIEEVRLSSVVRYTAAFARPTAPFTPDAATRALYHFDEGAGDSIGDTSGAAGGPSPGVRHFGGSPAGPVWVVSDAPISPGSQIVTLAFAGAASSVPEAGPAADIDVRLTTSNAQATTGAVTVQYATAAGTAGAGTDFTPASGTITFPGGSASGTLRSVAVAIVGDALDEADESFTVALSNPAGAIVGSPSTHAVTILDDDPLPALAAGDCATSEGDAGTTPCAFAVGLAPASGRDVTVSFATAGGTATSGADFLPVSGTLTFPAGVTERIVPAAVVGDTVVEPDETFALQLTAPSFAVLGDASGTGTIVDDDATPLPGLELAHGGVVRADLSGGPDVYRIGQPPLSSFEVIADDAGGDAGLVLERLAADGATVVQTGVPVGTGTARALRWANTLSTTVATQHLRVRSARCGTACGADDTYRLRAYETTGRLSRFNNTGGQGTIVLLQNPGAGTVGGHVHFWRANGTLLASRTFSLGPRALLKLDTFVIPAFQNQSGHVTVTHDGGYGGLAGKAGLVEPATGFSFDVPLTSLPR